MMTFQMNMEKKMRKEMVVAVMVVEFLRRKSGDTRDRMREMADAVETTIISVPIFLFF